MTQKLSDIFSENVMKAADDLVEIIDRMTAKEDPAPEQKEAPNTTGGSWDEDGELLNPFLEAQRVLGKAEESADSLDDVNSKTAALLEVAKIHTEIGKQLLDSFDF